MRSHVVAAVLLLAGCAGATPAPGRSVAFDSVMAHAVPAVGSPSIDVWVCHVPTDSTAAVYGRLPLRVDVTPARIVAEIGPGVEQYFAAISHGRFTPHFTAAGDVSIAADGGPPECTAAAAAAQVTSMTGNTSGNMLLVVADAEHAAGEPGGSGAPGPPPVAYVGASDFAPEWGQRPPRDLVEHELGHALGLPHSGYVASTTPPYRSALDLMSNSAAPRDLDPEARDAPDTIAVQRLLLGWLGPGDVSVAAGGGSWTLRPSTGPAGLRLVVLPVDRTRFLTVEWLDATGFDAHLPHGGCAVHLVEVDGSGMMLPPTPRGGTSPYADLLTGGAELVTDGWSVRCTASAEVTAARAPSP